VFKGRYQELEEGKQVEMIKASLLGWPFLCAPTRSDRLVAVDTPQVSRVPFMVVSTD